MFTVSSACSFHSSRPWKQKYSCLQPRPTPSPDARKPNVPCPPGRWAALMYGVEVLGRNAVSWECVWTFMAGLYIVGTVEAHVLEWSFEEELVLWSTFAPVEIAVYLSSHILSRQALAKPTWGSNLWPWLPGLMLQSPEPSPQQALAAPVSVFREWGWAQIADSPALAPGPCLSGTGCPETSVQLGESEHLPSGPDGSQSGHFSPNGDNNPGTCGFPFLMTLHQQAGCLGPHPPHQPMFPRPGFNFLLF